jgi:hypothetical protein
MQTHGFFDGCTQKRQIRCFMPARWGAQLARSGRVIDLSEQLFVGLRALHEVIEDGSHSDGRGV